jgi:hypothetical protein
MQAIINGGTVKKVKLTSVERRRLDEVEGLLHTVNALSPETVSDEFLSKYDEVKAKVLGLSAKQDDAQMEFPESVYTAAEAVVCGADAVE